MLATLAASLMLASPDLSKVCLDAANAAIARYPKDQLKPEDLAISVRIIAGGPVESGSFRGDQPFYPASVVKAFFLAYFAVCLDKGTVEFSEENQRAARDMIVASNNDATGHIVNVVTGALPGPSLPEAELKDWMQKRQVVNEWFRAKGYAGVNACQRTYNEGPYGRERQGLGPNYEHRNTLTTDACVRLMDDLSAGRLASPTRTDWMLSLLRREIPADSDKADGQSKGYTGKVLPSACKLWSKAGWTSEVRHDMALVEAPNGLRVAIAIFTKRGANAEMVSFLAAEVLKPLGIAARLPNPEDSRFRNEPETP